MTRAKEILKLMAENDKQPLPNCDSIANALTDRLNRFGFNTVSVDSVDVDFEGNITVDFVDTSDSVISVLFFYDSGASAMVLDNDGEELVTFDLDPVTPSTLSTDFGLYLNLIDVSWLNKSTLGAILTAGDYLDAEDAEDSEDGEAPTQDAFGYTVPGDQEAIDSIRGWESKATNEGRTVRAGRRKVRMPIVSSVSRAKAPYRVQAALQRLPKKSRKHSLKLEASAMPKFTVYRCRNGYQVLMKNTKDNEVLGAEFDHSGRLCRADLKDHDVENARGFVPSMDHLPAEIKSAVINYIQDRLN